jgi:hypothetical protein
VRAIIFLAVMCATTVASARTEKMVGYVRDQAWPTAVRFIRVDENLKIIEKDADAGYVLFELKEDGKTFRGSLEVVDVVKDEHHETRVVVSIDDRPSWEELQMLHRLERKLRVELGDPEEAPPPKKKPDDKKPKDDGAGAGSNEDKPKAEPSPNDDPPPQSPNP